MVSHCANNGWKNQEILVLAAVHTCPCLLNKRYAECFYCVESWWSLLGNEYVLRLVQVGVTGVIVILLYYLKVFFYSDECWRRSIVVRTLVSAGKLFLSCARLLAG